MIGGSPWARRLLATVGVLALVFLTVPIVIVIPMSFSSAKSLTFPPPGFSLKWYLRYLNDPTWIDATWRSLQVGTATTMLALLIGIPLAFGLARGRFRGRSLPIRASRNASNSMPAASSSPTASAS